MYIFNVGDGLDTIIDSVEPGQINTLQFGSGITPTDLSLGLGSLLIRVGTNGDAVHIQNFDPSNPYGPHAIETFRFADGSTLTYSQLIDKGFDLTGSAGQDTITGTNAMDRITGLAGNDVLQSYAGDDVLDGGAGADTLTGGTGSDTYIANDTGDTVIEAANEGTDAWEAVSYTLSANVELLRLTGTTAISGTGNELDNTLIGNGAGNVLDGRGGADTMFGGAGDDIYVVDDAHDLVTESASEGVDTVQSTISYALGDHLENISLTGGNAIHGTGKGLSNVLFGNDGANALNGDAGDDLLDGRAGVDVMAGGTGHDTYVVDDAADLIIVFTDAGSDTVQSSITHGLAANVENLTLTGTAAINGTGNALNNFLTGNSGNNVLDGGAGIDVLNEGAGEDTYFVDHVDDVTTEASDEGIDTVYSAVTYTLGANVEHLSLTGVAAIGGTGNALHNTMTGNSAANELDGTQATTRCSAGAGTIGCWAEAAMTASMEKLEPTP